MNLTHNGYSEDMIRLLGKRPFDRKDDMDKWLDENSPERSAPPPLEGVDSELSQTPSPAATRIDQDMRS